MRTVQEEATSIAKTRFGYPSLQKEQLAGIQSIMDGEDTMVILPTSYGKSAIFQIPALMVDGLVLVFSPLIALMKDQCDKLKRLGFKVGRLSGDMTDDEVEATIRRMRKLDILYVAPERLKSTAFIDKIKTTTVALVAVDEAHVLSLAQRDFRPAYCMVGTLLATILSHVPRIALTATADPSIENDIARALGMREYNRVWATPIRPNLTYQIQREWSPLKIGNLIRQHYEGQTVIVFANTRKEAWDTAEAFRTHLHLPAEAYHAGLGGTLRSEIQERFMEDQTRIIVATKAFGMGVDKKNVRLVAHLGPPGSIYDYAQEAGRAGRDGLPSMCILNMTDRGMNLQARFIRESNPDFEMFESVWKRFSKHDVREPFATNTQKIVSWLREDGFSLNMFSGNAYVRSLLGYLEFAQGILTVPDKTVHELRLWNKERFVRFMAENPDLDDVIELKGGVVRATVFAGSSDFTGALLSRGGCNMGDFPPVEHLKIARKREDHGIDRAELAEKYSTSMARLQTVNEFAETNDHHAFLAKVFSGSMVEHRIVEKTDEPSSKP